MVYLPSRRSSTPPPSGFLSSIANMPSFASTLLSAAIAVQAVLAGPIRARSPYVVKETHNAPNGWTKLDRADGDRIIQLQIGLKQGNFAELERQLWEGESLANYPIRA